ncbi:MAG TPA: GTPase Era [Kofleriaceae bacterium]|jgi:GTP-binding protein Era
MSDEPAPERATSEVRAGFCAIVGLPNVGKSTLLNRILDRHLVAVSAKPQTTRDRILGVHNFALPGETPARAQIAYVDTPGVQDGRGPLRRYMRDAALAAAADADAVLLLIDATDRRGRLPDRLAQPDAEGLVTKEHPIIIGLNKVDRVPKPDLLPLISAWAEFAPGADVVPISAQFGDGIDALERAVAHALPAGPALFPEELVTDRSPQFIAQEIIREQLYHQLGKELPYACAVQVETWTERAGKHGPELAIGAVIVVERDSQKPIVVGRGGSRIRELGIAARQAVGDALGKTVHLSLFVKVLAEWSRGEAELRRLGYGEAAK